MEHFNEHNDDEFTLKDHFGSRYTAQVERLGAELAPVGAIEVMQAALIIRYTLRLAAYDLAHDADSAELERARSLTQRNLLAMQKSLRQLQTDRFLKAELGLVLPGIPNVKEIARHRNARPAAAPPAAPDQAADVVREIEAKLEAFLVPNLAREVAALNNRTQFPNVMPFEMHKRTQSSGRNQPCPCGSGRKYKLCCLQKAA